KSRSSAAVSRQEYAGRLAGVGNSAVLIACTLGARGSRPAATASAKIASAKPCQLVWPAATRCQVPPTAASSSARRSATAVTSAISAAGVRSEEHTSELQSRENLVCRLLLEKKKRRPETSRCRNEAARR